MIFKLKHNCLAMQDKLKQGVDTPLLLKHCIVGIYYKSFNPFTTKDAIWRPGVINHPEINLLICYKFFMRFAIQCATSGKVTPIWDRLLG